MSSYVSVVGKPTAETCCTFGLTPQEVRYLQVSVKVPCEENNSAAKKRIKGLNGASEMSQWTLSSSGLAVIC